MKYVSGDSPSDNPPYHIDPEGMMGRASPDQIRSVWFGWLENLVSFHKINYIKQTPTKTLRIKRLL